MLPGFNGITLSVLPSVVFRMLFSMSLAIGICLSCCPLFSGRIVFCDGATWDSYSNAGISSPPLCCDSCANFYFHLFAISGSVRSANFSCVLPRFYYCSFYLACSHSVLSFIPFALLSSYAVYLLVSYKYFFFSCLSLVSSFRNSCSCLPEFCS